MAELFSSTKDIYLIIGVLSWIVIFLIMEVLMASRLMHLSIASQLERVLPIKDKNRFRIGSILPDAVLSANKWEVNTHFVDIYDNGAKKHFDFYRFFDRYEKEILSDALYLGYYFHLIQDCIFRSVLYYDIDLISLRGVPGFIDELYNDYRILNGWAIKRYGLEYNFFEPENFKHEKINEIYPFEVTDFIKDIYNDFNTEINEDPQYFKVEQAIKFINECIKVCVSEYKAIICGNHAVGSYDYSWETRTPDSKLKE